MILNLGHASGFEAVRQGRNIPVGKELEKIQILRREEYFKNKLQLLENDASSIKKKGKVIWGNIYKNRHGITPEFL